MLSFDSNFQEGSTKHNQIIATVTGTGHGYGFLAGKNSYTRTQTCGLNPRKTRRFTHTRADHYIVHMYQTRFLAPYPLH